MSDSSGTREKTRADERSREGNRVASVGVSAADAADALYARHELRSRVETAAPRTSTSRRKTDSIRGLDRSRTAFSWRVSRTLVILGMVVVDALIIFDAFAIAYLLRFDLFLFARTYLQPAPVDQYLKATVVVGYTWILIFGLMGLYRVSRRRSGVETVRLVVKAISIGTVLVLSLTYFYREFTFSRLACVYAWVISVVLFSAFRLAVFRARDSMRRGGGALRRVILVGSRTLARFLVEKTCSQRELGFAVVGCVDNKAPEISDERAPYLGELSELDRLITEHAAEGVLIAHPALGHYELLELIQVCERRHVAIRMVPPTYDLLIDYRDLEELDGMPLVGINEERYRLLGDRIKRVFDIVLASVALVASLPFWLLVAALIKLEDGGPVFFIQRRVGKNGVPFRMWKFRSMVLDAERVLAEILDVEALDEPVYKLADDPRVTRVGRFLRRTSLDELPQLLNVIRGEMSLVGPRPEEERIVEMYHIWERRRLKALPGLTGLQQVTCRGTSSLGERVRWDMTYVRKRSLTLDLWIILRTIWVVVSGKGAV